MAERLKRESISEKVERRMHRFTSSLEELSSSLNKCTWGCFGDSTVIAEPSTSSFDKNHSRSPTRRNTDSTESSSFSDDNDRRKKKPSSRRIGERNIGDDTIKCENDERNKTTQVHVGKDSNSSSSLMKKKEYQEILMRYAQLPSALSVELPDDYSEYSASFDLGSAM